MKEKLYDILSDYNEILKDIDAFINILEIELCYTEETPPALENTRNVTRSYLRLLRGVQTDSEELYNKIDKLILDIHKGGV